MYIGLDGKRSAALNVQLDKRIVSSILPGSRTAVKLCLASVEVSSLNSPVTVVPLLATVSVFPETGVFVVGTVNVGALEYRFCVAYWSPLAAYLHGNLGQVVLECQVQRVALTCDAAAVI